MTFFQGPTWHLLSLLFACLAVQVLSRSTYGTKCDNSTPDCEPPKAEGDSKSLEPQKCSGASSKQRYIGYSLTRHFHNQSCDILEPSDIDVDLFTHLYLGNNLMKGGEGPIVVSSDDVDRRRWKDFVNLKVKKPSLETYISVKPYSLDTGIPAPWLSDMVRPFENRTDVINSIVKLMDEFKFDGFNFDFAWRDIWQDDPKNSVLFLKGLHEAFGDKYGISAEFRATECALRNIDLPGMFEHLDHASFISYDSHTDVACKAEERWPRFPEDIERSVKLFRQANIDPIKLSPILDLGGLEWKLEDPKCSTPDCPRTRRRSCGKCDTHDYDLSAYDVERIMQTSSPEKPDVHYNTSVAYSWVTFENARSLKRKADIANENCLGGLAVQMVYTGGPATRANPNDLDPSDTSMRGAPSTNPSRKYVDDNAHHSETDKPSPTSTQSASLGTETSTPDSDTNGSTEGLSCRPVIGSVHVPIAHLDCDSDTTSTASQNHDALVHVGERVPSPSLAAPHEAGTSNELNAIGPKPTLTLVHRIGTPVDTAVKANDNGTTSGEPTNTP